MRCARLGLYPNLFVLAALSLLYPAAADSRSQDQCLVQSKQTLTKKALVQPALQSLLEQPGDPKHDFLSSSLTARIAFRLSRRWKSITLVFILVFALIFPFAHWHYEKRDVERYLFNDNNNRAGMPRSVVQVIRHIKINENGGLDKVCTLIDVDRPKIRKVFKGFIKTCAIAFNVYMLLQQDITLLGAAVRFYTGHETEALPKSLSTYLQFTGNESLVAVRHVVCVALAELLGLAAMVIWIIYRFVVFKVYRDSNEAQFDAFLALHEAFEGFALLSGFSALRLVNVFHPALLMRQFQWHMARPFLGGYDYHILQAAYFVVTRISAVFLGVLAFAVKMAFTSVQLHIETEGNPFICQLWRWSVVVMLLQQTLGAIGIEHLMWWRMILLVVEGGERSITGEKVLLSEVYLSMVFQRIYNEFWAKGKYFNFFLLMLTFDHVDLQHLLIEEDPDCVERTISLGRGSWSQSLPTSADGDPFDRPDFSSVGENYAASGDTLAEETEGKSTAAASLGNVLPPVNN